jgi:hypothetical protein
MGLGLYVFGDCTKPRDALLEDIATAAREAFPDVVLGRLIEFNESGHRALWLNLHPAEEPLEVSVTGSGRVLASARTSGAGPGYHAFVCELLDLIAERFAIRWQAVDPTGQTGDDTGYFHHRDRSRLEGEMRTWLRAIARSLSSTAADNWSGVAVSMPQTGPQYEADGAVTPLGPRDAAYWKQVETDDEAARRFFAWWEPGTGADYLLGRALCRMWTDVRWKAPETDAERATHAEVLVLLAHAFEKDSTRAYPFAEWAELLAFRGETLPVASGDATASQRAADPELAARPTEKIGYRRRDVVAKPFPGASVRIPGAFSESYDKRGSWSAWTEGRTVWLSLLTGKRGQKAPPPDQPEPVHEPADEEVEAHRVHGKRVVVTADEVRALMVSIVFTSPEHERWARDVYASVRFE